MSIRMITAANGAQIPSLGSLSRLPSSLRGKTPKVDNKGDTLMSRRSAGPEGPGEDTDARDGTGAPGTRSPRQGSPRQGRREALIAGAAAAGAGLAGALAAPGRASAATDGSGPVLLGKANAVGATTSVRATTGT